MINVMFAFLVPRRNPWWVPWVFARCLQDIEGGNGTLPRGKVADAKTAQRIPEENGPSLQEGKRWQKANVSATQAIDAALEMHLAIWKKT